TISEADITQRQIPVGVELHEYFTAELARIPERAGARPPEAWIEEQIARFANRVQSLAVTPLGHAWALKDLIEQVSPAELQRLNPDAKETWQRMIESPTLAIARETKRLRLDLEPIFFPIAPAQPAPGLAGLDDQTDLRRMIERLVKLTSAHDEIIGKAFSKSPRNSISPFPLTVQFWHSLRAAEKLAAKILAQQAR